MRIYRNDTGGPLTLATEPPCTVEPGWTVHADAQLAGLTEIDEDGEPVQAGAGGGVAQVGPEAPTPGTPAAEPPANTSDRALPLSEVHLEPPADWPVEGEQAPADDAGEQPQARRGPRMNHQVVPAAGVTVDPAQGDAGDAGTAETLAGDVPAPDQQ